jgi:Luciferase-like monooxygenase
VLLIGSADLRRPTAKASPRCKPSTSFPRIESYRVAHHLLARLTTAREAYDQFHGIGVLVSRPSGLRLEQRSGLCSPLLRSATQVGKNRQPLANLRYPRRWRVAALQSDGRKTRWSIYEAVLEIEGWSTPFELNDWSIARPRLAAAPFRLREVRFAATLVADSALTRHNEGKERSMDVGMMMVFASYGWQDCSDARVWDEEIRLARLAADLGFDCLWSAEHHFNDYSFVPDNIQLMTYLTASS